MPRSLRPLLLLAASLAGAHCSLDLDESLISGTGGDASLEDASSLGGFEGGGWSDAEVGAPAIDASPEADSTADAPTEASDSGPVAAGVDCGPNSTCADGSICCWSGNASTCAASVAECTNVAIACDETNDCGAGEVCCILDVSASSVGCAISCPDTLIGAIQFCDSDSECTSNVCDTPLSLIANLLPPGYKACK